MVLCGIVVWFWIIGVGWGGVVVDFCFCIVVRWGEWDDDNFLFGFNC